MIPIPGFAGAGSGLFYHKNANDRYRDRHRPVQGIFSIRNMPYDSIEGLGRWFLSDLIWMTESVSFMGVLDGRMGGRDYKSIKYK